MKMLYVAPRYHTNQVPIMRGWKEKKVEVKFLVQYVGAIEEHDGVSLKKMKKSLITSLLFHWIDKRTEGSFAEDLKMRKFTPSFWDVLKEIKNFQPDVVIMRERNRSTAVAFAACRILGIKKVLLYNQTPLYQENIKVSGIKKLCMKLFFPGIRFTPVLYRGKQLEGIEEGIYKANKEYFVPLVAEKVFENRTKPEIHSKLRILDVGKFREYKNHFFLIDALEPLNMREDLNVTILGQAVSADEKDYFERLSKYIKDKGLKKIVSLRPNIPYSDMHNIYQENDVLVLTSRFESAGMVIMEAMAERMCVVSSSNCGLSCYLEKDNCGFTYPVDRCEALTDIIKVLLEDREKVFAMGERAGDTVKKKYMFSNYYDALADILYKEFSYKMDA